MYQKVSIRFGHFEFEVHGNAELEQEMISLEELIEIGNLTTYVLKQTKTVFLSSYYFSSRIHCFLRKSTLRYAMLGKAMLTSLSSPQYPTVNIRITCSFITLQV